MKLLVTAFEPFGGRTCNTSQDLLSELRNGHNQIGLLSYRFAILPVNFYHAWPTLRKHLVHHKPDAVLLLGEKTSTALTLETTARNQRISKRGLIPIAKNSAQRITSPLPVTKIGTALRRRFHSGKKFLSVSDNAGTYLCNFIYYKMLSSRLRLPALFVHVPALNNDEFGKRRKKIIDVLHHAAIELVKAIDGAGANYTSREN